MNTILGKLLVPHYIEYLVIDENFLILETSSNVQQYADMSYEVVAEKDIRLGFPELVGVESSLIEILKGRQKSFELQGIARSNEPGLSLYIDLYITKYDSFLVVLVEDATKRMLLEQKLFQEYHEKNILLSSLNSYQNYLDQIITSMQDVLFVTTNLGKIITVNRAALELFEYNQNELVNKSISLIANDSIFLSHVKQLSDISYKGSLKDNTVACQTKTGKKLIVAFSSSIMKSEEKNSHYIVFTGRDITEREITLTALFEEKELAQITLKSIGDAVITTDVSGRIKYLNPVAEKLTGWTKADALFKPVTEIFKIVNEINREPLNDIVKEVLSSGHVVTLGQEYLLIACDGREIAIDDSVAPIHTKNGQIVGAVIVFQDASHKRNITRQLSWQANHDALTGLVNRREFENNLFATLNSNNENQQNVLCYLDLDRFKIVNDTCGHMAGDELLRQVALLFQNLIRCSDILARLGGDEFGILLKGCRLASALQITNTIVERVQEFRFVWQDKTFNIGVSIGLVTIYTDENRSMSTLLKAADTACYIAKNKGRNCVHVYQAENSELVKTKNEMQWVAEITQALENNSFSLYYQPIIPITSTQSSCIHYEVLLRLMDTTGNEVLPMAFIPAAERYNMMPAIDRWVIETLFANFSNCEKEKLNNCTAKEGNNSCVYAINLSGASINDNKFIDFLCDKLELYQIPAQAICFEITESVVTANLAKVASKVRALKELGFWFALDNFGSSMSSWGYLKNLSIDYLKINGTLIKNIAEEKIDAAIVEAINQIAHLMGIQTIAEYVETQEMFETIKTIGVDYAQGYSIAKPSPLKIW